MRVRRNDQERSRRFESGAELSVDLDGGEIGVRGRVGGQFRTRFETPHLAHRPFLRERRARGMTTPYRRNRAVIFNSDLFHATDALRFRPRKG